MLTIFFRVSGGSGLDERKAVDNGTDRPMGGTLRERLTVAAAAVMMRISLRDAVPRSMLLSWMGVVV